MSAFHPKRPGRRRPIADVRGERVSNRMSKLSKRLFWLALVIVLLTGIYLWLKSGVEATIKFENERASEAENSTSAR